ncbi:pinensin family lanthipeptide [Luteibaculum oceani]|uniref:Uncharacterized protein n=1 Tax=Luteibaculum oceani TaxID=1294296 RepID=A0A5C6VIA3_9FLAO|nr:pinensin family lanthipeptide [Luteibaculum oceani]TXC85232.1 hypothetical protein FRX97_01005 [Luteibaculum oceani]
MKKKLKLNSIKVESFVTELKDQARDVKGGAGKPEIPTFERCSQVDACLTAAYTFRTACAVCQL